jgi:hypothetical protein
MNACLQKILFWVLHMNDRALVVGLFALFFVKSQFSIDPDFGWHLRSGEYMLAHGVPQIDIYTYTATNFPWIHHEWLADISNFLVYQVGGYTLLAVVYALMWTAAFYLVARPFPVKQYVLLAALVALPYAGVRAASWTIVLLSLLVVVLRQVRREQWLWALPILLLWANVHGSFVVGLLYLAYHAAWQRNWQAMLLLVMSVLLTLMNPYGVDMYTEVFRTAADTELHQRIGEWKSFQLEVGLGMIVAAWVMARIVADWRRPWRAVLHPDVMLLVLALSASRHIPVFALASLPVVLECSRRMPSLATALADRRIVATVAMLAILVVLTLGYAGLRTVLIDPESAYPREIAHALNNQPCRGNLFNDYNDGGYLIWRAPGQKVFIDGRMPSWRMGDSDYFAMYEHILKDTSYQKMQFDRYDITCVLAASEGAFTRRLHGQGWHESVSAAGYVLLEKTR